MSKTSVKRVVQLIAAELVRFGLLLIPASFVGGLIGCLVGTIAGTIGGESGLGIDFGFMIGSVVGFVFYAVAHWFVFRLPVERVAKHLIAGTLIGSVPLAFIPVYGAVLSLYGGILGYWLGLVELLIRVWGEKRAVRQKEDNGETQIS